MVDIMPFVLVLEDVAVEHETAELRSVELDHHQHAGPGRQGVVVVEHVPVDRRGQPSIAETLGYGRAAAGREIRIEHDELGLVDVEVVALVAVVDEQPILLRAIGSGQVRIAVHLERRVELANSAALPCLPAAALQHGSSSEIDAIADGAFSGRSMRPSDSRSATADAVFPPGPASGRFSDVDAEQLAPPPEVRLLNRIQADQVGIDPESAGSVWYRR